MVSVHRSGLSTAVAPSGAFALWLSLASASAVAAANPTAGFQELALLIGCLALTDLTRRCGASENVTWIARGAVVGAGLYAGMVFLIFAAAVLSADALYISSIILGFDNYRFLNHSQTVLLPILAVAAASDREWRWRRIASTVLIAQFSLLVLTRGRATMLALTVATLAAFWLARSTTSRALLRTSAWTAFGGVLVYWTVLQGLPTLLGLPWLEQADPAGDLNSGHERLFLWSHALQSIRQSPWLGIGPMHFAALHLDPGAHPHNVYLQWLAEYGLIAGALMSAALLAVVYKGARRLRAQTQPAPLATGAWIACMAAILDGLLSGNFVMPLSQCWIAFAFGLLMHFTSSASHPATTGPRSVVAIAVVLLSLAGLTVKVAWDVSKSPPFAGKALQHTDPGKSLDPRFWLHGRI
jgi:O-antigen ligase